MITKRKLKYFLLGFLTYLLIRFMFFIPNVKAYSNPTVNGNVFYSDLNTNYPDFKPNRDNLQLVSFYPVFFNRLVSYYSTDLAGYSFNDYKYTFARYSNGAWTVYYSTCPFTNTDSANMNTSSNTPAAMCDTLYFNHTSTSSNTLGRVINFTEPEVWSLSSSYTLNNTTSLYNSNYNNWTNTYYQNYQNSNANYNYYYRLDFSQYFTRYINIEYQDSNFHVLDSVVCTDKNIDCTLSINDNSGTYILVKYHVIDWLDGYLILHPNNTYRFGTYLIGSNDYTSAYLFELFFNHQSGQGNPATLSYFPYNQNISFLNDRYEYKFNINITDTITADLGVYDFYVRYKTNGTYYTDVTVPYSFSLYDVTNNTNVVMPEDGGITVDSNSIIISQNDTIINNQYITNDYLNEINSSINDDNTTGATGQATSYFSNFQNDTHGLTGIISMPLIAIGRITSSSCTPINIPFPHTNDSLVLACLSPYYRQYIPSLLTLWQTWNILSIIRT